MMANNNSNNKKTATHSVKAINVKQYKYDINKISTAARTEPQIKRNQSFGLDDFISFPSFSLIRCSVCLSLDIFIFCNSPSRKTSMMITQKVTVAVAATAAVAKEKLRLFMDSSFEF